MAQTYGPEADKDIGPIGPDTQRLSKPAATQHTGNDIDMGIDTDMGSDTDTGIDKDTGIDTDGHQQGHGH